MTQEAKMYVNNRGFWYKQTERQNNPSVTHFLLAHGISRSYNPAGERHVSPWFKYITETQIWETT